MDISAPRFTFRQICATPISSGPPMSVPTNFTSVTPEESKNSTLSRKQDINRNSYPIYRPVIRSHYLPLRNGDNAQPLTGHIPRHLGF